MAYAYQELEDRTFHFAERVRSFGRKVQKSENSKDDIDQLIRASGSVGANYIEANESLGKGDFAMRIRISKKEAKESLYWLRLIQIEDELQNERDNLINEAKELMLIFASILSKCTKKK